jgi:hypothetical protein
MRVVKRVPNRGWIVARRSGVGARDALGGFGRRSRREVDQRSESCNARNSNDPRVLES